MTMAGQLDAHPPLLYDSNAPGKTDRGDLAVGLLMAGPGTGVQMRFAKARSRNGVRVRRLGRCGRARCARNASPDAAAQRAHAVKN